MRCVSSAPFFPTSTPTSFIFPLLFCFGHLFRLYATANRTHHAPVVAIQNRSQPCRALHPDTFPHARRELWQLRGPEVFLQYRCALYLGSLRTHWCKIHFFLPPTFRWPSLALASSAALPSSLHFCARLDLAVRILLLHCYAQLPLCSSSRSISPAFGLDTIPLVVALCDPSPLG
jgi:hypothetical protein